MFPWHVVIGRLVPNNKICDCLDMARVCSHCIAPIPACAGMTIKSVRHWRTHPLLSALYTLLSKKTPRGGVFLHHAWHAATHRWRGWFFFGDFGHYASRGQDCARG
mgnify:CR=1 FL=1